jgi:hypothetical protein
MKLFVMLKIPVILFGIGGALLLSSSCKAQEVSPDHFTETGVQDVYESAPNKTLAPAVKKTPALHTRKHQTSSAVTAQLTTTKPRPLLTAQPVVEKRKRAASAPKKP